MRLIRKLKNIVNNINPDIIHAQQITDMAYLLPFIKHHPYMLSAWGSDVLIRPNMANKPIKAFIYSTLASHTIKNADILHCDGFKTNNALEKLGAKKAKIVHINFGTDIEIFHPSNKSYKVKTKYGLQNCITVISTRQLENIYDVETLIKSIPIVLNNIIDIKFMIVGTGGLENKLKQISASLNVSSNVVFTGYVSEKEMPQYVASADIYVSTSLSDSGLACSTAEAMASGVPVIITDDIDNRDWIQDGENGFIVPIKNPDILAQRIIQLATNENLRSTMGTKGRDTIIARNNYSLEMSKIESIYENIISSNFIQRNNKHIS